jgi:hypothetical protein
LTKTKSVSWILLIALAASLWRAAAAAPDARITAHIERLLAHR